MDAAVEEWKRRLAGDLPPASPTRHCVEFGVRYELFIERLEAEGLPTDTPGGKKERYWMDGIHNPDVARAVQWVEAIMRGKSPPVSPSMICRECRIHSAVYYKALKTRGYPTTKKGLYAAAGVAP